MENLFDLNVGDRFRVNGGTFTIKSFARITRPRIGKTSVCKTIDDNGKKAWFIHNHQVEKVLPSYLEWKKTLIEVTKNELSASGYYPPFSFKIIDSEAIKAYNDGMTPLQCFREFFNQ